MVAAFVQLQIDASRTVPAGSLADNTAQLKLINGVYGTGADGWLGSNASLTMVSADSSRNPTGNGTNSSNATFTAAAGTLGATGYVDLPAGNWTGVVMLTTVDGGSVDGLVTAEVLPGIAYTAVIHIAAGEPGALPEMLLSKDEFKTDKETPALKSWVKVVHASSTAGPIEISSDTDDDFMAVTDYEAEAPFLPIIASKQRLLIRARANATTPNGTTITSAFRYSVIRGREAAGATAAADAAASTAAANHYSADDDNTTTYSEVLDFQSGASYVEQTDTIDDSSTSFLASQDIDSMLSRSVVSHLCHLCHFMLTYGSTF